MLQPASATIVAVLLVAALFGFRIASLVEGTTYAERDLRSSTIQLRSIADNPVNAPYKTAQYVVGKVNRTVSSQRLVSGLAAGLMILLFYTIASRLFRRYVALGTTLMFATSSALLHIGRSGTPDIMLLTMFALIVCGYGARFSVRNSRWLLITSAAVGLSLFVPGMVYFLVAGAVWQFKSIKRAVQTSSPLLIAACSAIILASLTPIVLSIINDTSLVKAYLGLPAKLPSPVTMLKTMLSVPAGVVAFAPKDAYFRLGRLPLLDVFGAGMLILGCYGLVKKYSLDRTRLLAGILIVTMLWCGVSGDYRNSLLLLPFVYLVVGTGMSWFIRQWRSVFPRNPLAIFIAYILLGGGILLSCNYQLQRYFLAWPDSPETKAVYTRE